MLSSVSTFPSFFIASALNRRILRFLLVETDPSPVIWGVAKAGSGDCCQYEFIYWDAFQSALTLRAQIRGISLSHTLITPSHMRFRPSRLFRIGEECPKQDGG